MWFKKGIYITICLFAFYGLSAQNNVERVSGGVKEKVEVKLDTVFKPHLQSKIFRDTLPISRVCALSLIAPGFGQLYNGQYWKIPVLYGAVGGFTYLTVDTWKKYSNYKKQYDNLRFDENSSRGQIESVQRKMIQYNTRRTVFLAGAALTYLYFIGDAAINYPNNTTNVKKATTLAMIFPGAGQMYNKSYWKVPIVVGAFATMGYVLDFNSRGYNRFKEAYNRFPNDEFNGRYPQTSLKNMRDRYRRNRDLSIILTGGLYILSVVEAHVDAYLKDYDISDDLAVRVEPTMIDMSGLQASANGNTPGFGLALRMNF